MFAGRQKLVTGVTFAGLIAAALGGVLAGVGVFTFDYARGFSYLSKDPTACANCHIMHSQFDGWQKASHRAAAGCADCHLPRAGLEMWLEKANNGYRHGTAFTLDNYAEPIEMTPRNREILQTNCEGCHSSLTAEHGPGPADGFDCVHCHRSVGHGERAAVGAPLRMSSNPTGGHR